MVALSLKSEEVQVATRRRILPGPESTLLFQALETGIPVFSRTPEKIFLEFEMPTGFPDLVALFFKRKSLIELNRWNSLSKNHLRLLHHIFIQRKTSIEQICSMLLFSKKEVEAVVEELVRRNAIRLTSNHIYIRSASEVFPLKKIVAIEAKVNDWQRCLKQAALNTWFASESYMLIPENRNSKTILSSAEKHGVGVLIFNGKEVNIAKQAKHFLIPSSFGSWLLAGA